MKKTGKDEPRIVLNEMFLSIQGEGSNAGVKALFIRLSGCNLKCDFCDTKGHKKGIELPVRKIVEKAQFMMEDENVGLIVITGGEPTAQKNCIILVKELHKKFCEYAGTTIAVETNETRFPINPARLSEIVSSLVDESGVDDILRSIPFSKDQVEGMQILSNAKPKKEEKKDSFETAYYVICEKCGEKHYTDEYGNPLESE